MCGDLLWVVEPRGLHQLLQRMQCAAMKVLHPVGLGRYDQRLLAQRILRGDARWAVAGMAGLRLNAPERHHETATRVAPIGAQRHHPRQVESRDHLACTTDLDAAAQADADQRVVHQKQPFLQRRADVVAELDRRRAGPALGTVDDDEVRRDAGLLHRLDDGEPLPRMAQAELEPGRLAARQLTQPGNEIHHLDGRAEGAVRRRRDAVDTDRHAARR